MTNEETKARELVLSIYERHSDARHVSPSWLATEAMHSIDPGRSSHPIEYAMAHLQFRQLARSICAGRWRESERADPQDQHELFPMLQKRYPTSHSVSREEPEYVLLEYMTAEDVRYNVERLRSEAASKQKHADALAAYWANRTQQNASAHG